MEVTALKSGLIIPGRTPVDPDVEKAKLLEQIGGLDGITVMGNNIMVAKWVRDKEGSVHLTDQSRKEDIYQGCVGLVLMVGPLAYKEDDNTDWGGQKIEAGQWVQYRYSDGEDFDIKPAHSFKNITCSWIKEGYVKAILPRPDMVF